MPKPTFFRLPDARRERVVEEAIVEFGERSYAEASLSQIVARAGIAKGSVYQYFDGKLELYRWLLTDEVPRRKREFLGVGREYADVWEELEERIERGMAFLVEHPRLARITAAATDPAADEEVHGLHRAVCEAGNDELRALLERGVSEGAIARGIDLEVAARFVAAVIGPGLTDVVLHELGATLHEILASDTLRKRLGRARRRRLAHEAVSLIRHGLGRGASRQEKKR